MGTQFQFYKMTRAVAMDGGESNKCIANASITTELYA